MYLIQLHMHMHTNKKKDRQEATALSSALSPTGKELIPVLDPKTLSEQCSADCSPQRMQLAQQSAAPAIVAPSMRASLISLGVVQGSGWLRVEWIRDC